MTDRELLREFVQTRSEPAFTEIVRRHIDLVYSAARRQCDDPGLAEDVTQIAFIQLARKAGTIRRGEAIAGWLLAVTRSAALNQRRAASRRARHESETAAMRNQADTPDEPSWESIRPMLDEAIAGLKPADRDALTLRYLQDRSFEDVAAAMGVSEAAARKRVTRAVVKLRELFAQRGMTTSAQALATVLLANALIPAPEALAAHVAQAALTSGVLAAGSATAAKGATILMGMTKAKSAVLAAVAALVGLGTPAIVLLNQEPAHSLTPAQPSPVQKPTTSGDWKAEFQSVYALKPGQMLKHVAPPFVRGREEFVRGMKLQPSAEYPVTIVFDGHSPQDLRWRRRTGDDWSVGETLINLVDIWPQDTDISRKTLITRISGDWVTRPGASREQILPQLISGMPEVFGPEMALKQEPMEREAIVVRGTLQYRPMPQVKEPNARLMEIHLYRGREDYGGTRLCYPTQSTEHMLQWLGHLTGRPIVIESTLDPKQRFNCISHKTADYRNSSEAPDVATVKEIIANVAAQTSLELKLEKRSVPAWRLTKQVRADSYRLSPGQVLAYIPNPPPEVRHAVVERYQPIPDIPVGQLGAVIFRWDGYPMPLLITTHGPTTLSLREVLARAAGLIYKEIEGYDIEMPGDIVFRPNAEPEQVCAALQGILRQQLGRDISLSFREEKLPVIVLRGQWKHRPVPVKPGTKRPPIRPTVEFYNRIVNPDRLTGVGSKCNSPAELAQDLGNWIDQKVFIEAEVPMPIDWHADTDEPDAQRRDAKLVLEHVKEQTGLNWSEETRAVRRLYIEAAK